jgi:hypothetical protein
MLLGQWAQIIQFGQFPRDFPIPSGHLLQESIVIQMFPILIFLSHKSPPAQQNTHKCRKLRAIQ